MQQKAATLADEGRPPRSFPTTRGLWPRPARPGPQIQLPRRRAFPRGVAGLTHGKRERDRRPGVVGVRRRGSASAPLGPGCVDLRKRDLAGLVGMLASGGMVRGRGPSGAGAAASAGGPGRRSVEPAVERPASRHRSAARRVFSASRLRRPGPCLLGGGLGAVAGMATGLASAENRLVAKTLAPARFPSGHDPDRHPRPVLPDVVRTVGRSADRAGRDLHGDRSSISSRSAACATFPLPISTTRRRSARRLLSGSLPVRLPGAMPEIFGGLRIACAAAWGLAAVTEMLGGQYGCGPGPRRSALGLRPHGDHGGGAAAQRAGDRARSGGGRSQGRGRCAGPTSASATGGRR